MLLILSEFTQKQYDVLTESINLYNAFVQGRFDYISRLSDFKEKAKNCDTQFVFNKISEIYGITDFESFQNNCNFKQSENRFILDEDAAEKLVEALELYTKLLTGKFSHLDWFMTCNSQDLGFDELDDVRALENVLKKMYFPELKKGTSYKITSANVSDMAKIAYDILQVVRSKLDQYYNQKCNHRLSNSSFESYSDEKMIKCEFSA